MKFKILTVLLFTALLIGCANVVFDSDEGLLYYEPVPYLMVSVDQNCKSTAQVISLPGDKKRMRARSGLGTAKLEADLSNGMVTSIGQTIDSKVPETLSSVGELVTAGAGILGAGEDDGEKRIPDGAEGYIQCPSIFLYPITAGKIDTSNRTRDLVSLRDE